MGDPGTVFSILATIVEGWGKIVVRVKQDGRLKFLPLSEVRDQSLLLKIVRDLIKQSAVENGIGVTRKRGL